MHVTTYLTVNTGKTMEQIGRRDVRELGLGYNLSSQMQLLCPSCGMHTVFMMGVSSRYRLDSVMARPRRASCRTMQNCSPWSCRTQRQVSSGSLLYQLTRTGVPATAVLRKSSCGVAQVTRRRRHRLPRRPRRRRKSRTATLAMAGVGERAQPVREATTTRPAFGGWG